MQVEVRPAARRTRRPDIVPERAQRVDHRQKLEDMRRVVLLRRRQLAAFVRHWVLVPLVVRLCQDRRHSDVARIRRQNRAAGRIEGA